MERPPHILAVTPQALADWIQARGEPGYRTGQVLDWVYRKFATEFAQMTNLSLALREALAQAFDASPLPEVRRQATSDSATGKLLFGLPDGEEIESVWMEGEDRPTFCISSQAGCALGCEFCATGATGFGRDLAVHEILGQVHALARACKWPANVVFMGMGEPLLNLPAVLPALEALTDEARFAVGARRITVSTAGIADGIRELARSSVRPNLALSLNSPFDEERSSLMPVNRAHPLGEVLHACAEYAEGTGRRMTLEYVLLHEVNTSAEHARAVVKIARRLEALVNLIAFNPVPGCRFGKPEQEEMHLFHHILDSAGISVTERFRRGREIAAGCGQLRGKHARGAKT